MQVILQNSWYCSNWGNNL